MTPISTEPQSLWKFIPNSHFSRPSRPIEETVRLSVINILEKLRANRVKNIEFFNQQKLSAIALNKLDRVVPSINSEIVALAIDQFFINRFDKQEPASSTFVLCPPSSGLEEVLSLWGKQHNWPLLPSPNYEEILDKFDKWFPSIRPKLESPFIIPHLEHWYLRHFKGLNLLRLFLNHLQTINTPCIIGLDTWAWTYLKYAVQIDTFPQLTIILEAFDSDMLHSLFTELSRQNYKRQIFFRETTTGKLVLKSLSTDTQGKKGLQFDNNFLKNLAGYTHGNPFLAWNIWRNSLRSDPDEEFLSKEEDTDVTASEKRRTLWILPWEKVEIPTVPETLNSIDLTLLQTILIHNGVSTSFLPDLLTFSPDELNRSLSYLTKLGLLEAKGDRLEVNPLVYPRIRDKLNGEGFLTDEI